LVELLFLLARDGLVGVDPRALSNLLLCQIDKEHAMHPVRLLESGTWDEHLATRKEFPRVHDQVADLPLVVIEVEVMDRTESAIFTLYSVSEQDLRAS
jgi:hypothetical protein